jgi:hypothetical protein
MGKGQKEKRTGQCISHYYIALLDLATFANCLQAVEKM